MKKRLMYNTVTSLLLQVVTVICGFITPRLFLSEYGSEVNGLVQSVTQFLGVISFLELGVGQVIQSALYKPLAKSDSNSVDCVLASGGKFFRRIAYILLAYIAVLVFVYPPYEVVAVAEVLVIEFPALSYTSTQIWYFAFAYKFYTVSLPVSIKKKPTGALIEIVLKL